MELTHNFTVPATVEAAWAVFNDLERITPCFPGAALSSYDGETFAGGVKVKLGPISMQYTGTGRFIERDEGSHRAVIEAKGKDKRGNGTAAATITAELTAAGGAQTAVVVRTDLNITGKPAQFGRGVMQDVSDKLLGQFATCLEAKLAEPDEPGSATDQQPVSAEPVAAPEPVAGAEPAGSPEPVAVPEPVAAAEPVESRATTSTATRHAESTPGAELHLGATVLPILLRRYAPHLVATAAALWLLRRLLRRG